ncbi:MAG: hypothetical protein ABII18_05785 [bacterium]
MFKLKSLRKHYGNSNFKALAKIQIDNITLHLRVIQQNATYRPYVDWPGGIYESDNGKTHYYIVNLPPDLKEHIDDEILYSYKNEYYTKD